MLSYGAFVACGTRGERASCSCCCPWRFWLATAGREAPVRFARQWRAVATSASDDSPRNVQERAETAVIGLQVCFARARDASIHNSVTPPTHAQDPLNRRSPCFALLLVPAMLPQQRRDRQRRLPRRARPPSATAGRRRRWRQADAAAAGRAATPSPQLLQPPFPLLLRAKPYHKATSRQVTPSELRGWVPLMRTATYEPARRAADNTPQQGRQTQAGLYSPESSQPPP